MNQATWCQLLNAMPNLQSITINQVRTFNRQQGPPAVVNPKLHLKKLELINSTSELLQTLMNPICELTTFSVIIGNPNLSVAPNPRSLVGFLRMQPTLQTLNIDVTYEAENLQLFNSNRAEFFPFTLRHLKLKICGRHPQPNVNNMINFVRRQSASLHSFKIGHYSEAVFEIIFDMAQLQQLTLYHLPPVSPADPADPAPAAPAAHNILNTAQLQIILHY